MNIMDAYKITTPKTNNVTNNIPPLYNHQKEAVEFILARNGNAALFHDVGVGKTRTVLESFDQMLTKKIVDKMIVICPINLIKHAWGQDIEKFVPHLSWASLRDKPKQAHIYITNYERCLKNPPWVDSRTLLVLDESSRIKNGSSLTTKQLLKLSEMTPHKIIMTGTPAPNSMLEYYSQLEFLKQGFWGCKNSFIFRHKYFVLARGREKIEHMIKDRKVLSELHGKGYKWTIKEKHDNEILAKMKPVVHYCDKANCIDLPENISVNRYVTLGTKQLQVYKDMKKFNVASPDDEGYIIAKNALVKAAKLRQITSGFMIDTDNGKTTGRLSEQPKLNELKNILDEIGDKQAIIWITYHEEVKMIMEVLKDQAVTLCGLTEDKDYSIQSFISKEKQYLVAHPASAGHGLTFVNCNVQIFYSLDYSYERYHQALGRTYRAGQKNPCTNIHILAQDSVDEAVLECLQNKKDLLEAMQEYMLK